MRQPITFIHCADLHLDSPFQGMKTVSGRVFETMKESTFYALDKLVEQAIFHKVDFVLVAGDVFDHPKPSLKALMRFKKAMERLEKNHIQVFISYGNHDFSQSREEMVALPANVHLFSEEKVTGKSFFRDGMPVAHVYGFSYNRRAVTENKVSEYIREEGDGYHIAMLHGSISTNTEHDVYAPFQLSELVEKPFDYWALGHIHKREILQQAPPVVYPGNAQGRSRKESGEKGCMLVEMAGHETKMEFLPLQHVRFESFSIEINEVEDISIVERLIHEKMVKIREEIGCAIIDLKIESTNSVLNEWQQNGYMSEVMEAINDQFSDMEDWVLVRNWEIETIPEWNLDELRSGGHFIGELIRNVEKDSQDTQVLLSLFNHRKARNYLEPLTEEEMDGLRMEARDELLRLLMKE